MTDITPILLSLITLCIALTTVCIIPILREKLSKEKRENLSHWVEVGVNAAEQLCKSGVINKDERKQHVIDFLESKGYTADINSIEELLESFVSDLPELIIKDVDEKKGLRNLNHED